MMILFPILCFVLILLTLTLRPIKDNAFCWRDSLISSYIAWNLLVAASTEFLSVFNLITLKGLSGAWIAASILSAVIYIYKKNKAKIKFSFNLKSYLSKDCLVLLGGIFLVALLTGFIAIMSPPSTWDSMSCYLSRVAHWIQNKSLTNYPTHILSQLIYSPGPQYIILHLQILSGGDYLANLPQYCSMLGSLAVVSLIVKELGGDRLTQVFAALVCATIPMAIVQSSSAQTDYVASFWLACFIYYVLKCLKRITNVLLLKLGAVLGLALLTKGTLYIYLIPFIIWLILICVKKLKSSLWKVLYVFILAAVINAGYYFRIIQLYGTVRIPSSHAFIEHINLQLYISNVTKHLGLYLGGLPFLNFAVREAIKLFHHVFNIDVNNPFISFGPEFNIPFIIGQDTASNFIHFILIVFCITIFIRRKLHKEDKILLYYTCSVSAMFFIFCFFLKWNLYNVRYQLPIFVAFSPFIALMLSKIKISFYNNKSAKIAIYIIASFILLSFILYKALGANVIESLYNCRPFLFPKTVIKEGYTLNYYLNQGDKMGLNFLIFSAFILSGLFAVYRFKFNLLNSIGALLILGALPWIFLNVDHALIGKESFLGVKREYRYFNKVSSRPWRASYEKASDFIASNNHSQIGVILKEDDYEYPFFAFLKKRIGYFRIEHVNVDNVSAKAYAAALFKDFKPTAVISINDERDRIRVRDDFYSKAWHDGSVVIFVKE